MSDLVSRSDLIKRLEERANTAPELQYTYPLMKDIEAMVYKMPTIDAVPVVHGWWETIERDEVKSEIVAECSECGAVFASTIFTFALNYNYCANCGARMDGEEE